MAKTRPQPAPARPSLTGIEVAGFKSIKEARSIDLKPLTILAGANSSGKSSMLQPLLLLKQTVDAPFDPGPLRLNGPNLKFTRAEQVLSRLGESFASFSVNLRFDDGEGIGITFTADNDGGFKIGRWSVENSAGEASVTPSSRGIELEAMVRLVLPREMHQPFIEEIRGSADWELTPARCVFHLDQRLRRDGGVVFGGVEPFHWFLPLLDRLLHVPSLRGTFERSYPVSAVGVRFPGQFDDYVASIIDHWQRKKDPRLMQLASDLNEMGLTDSVEARRIDGTQVELMVGLLPDSAEGGTVNIADVGFGVSQVLPVLVAILAAEPGQLVCIEQPEIHLHPRAHVALAAILAREAENGKLLAVETHSSHVLLGIQTAVAEKKLKPENVALHWFERDATGQTNITRGDLDETGAFGDWPVDFDDVSMDQDMRFVRSSFEAAE